MNEMQYKYGTLVECYLQGPNEVLWDKPIRMPFCQHHISHVDWPGSNPGLCSDSLASNFLNHGMAIWDNDIAVK